MTKYVVNSGGIRNEPELKKQFHQEIVKGLGNNPKFLLCNFAQGREFWEEKFQNYCDEITEDMPVNLNPSFTLAMPEELEKQCSEAGIIYFHGGDDHLLKYWMSKFDLAKLFNDKVVATNSASSNMLSSYYWTCDWRECGEGLGVLPIKFISHFRSDFGVNDPRGPIDWDGAKRELKQYGNESLPIYALKEGEYEVFEQ